MPIRPSGGAITSATNSASTSTRSLGSCPATPPARRIASAARNTTSARYFRARAFSSSAPGLTAPAYSNHRLLDREVADLEHDGLALGREHPVDDRLDLAGRLGAQVEEERPRQRVGAVLHGH